MTDVDGDGVTVTVVGSLTPSTAGTLSVTTQGGYLYQPAANWHGTATFTYKANDGTADSNVATVTLSVASVNDVPVAKVWKRENVCVREEMMNDATMR